MLFAIRLSGRRAANKMMMLSRCLACDCDANGTVADTTCDPRGGQCKCHDGVGGRRCDYCQPGFYGFSSSGCLRTYCSVDSD